MEHPFATQNTPLVIAHRGASYHYPENTKASLTGSLHPDIIGAELDLQLTKDKIPVFYHDRTLNKINKTRKRISHLRLAELKKLDFGAWFNNDFKGERILTLEEALTYYPQKKHLFLELKERLREKNLELADMVVPIVKRYRQEKRVHILAFDFEIVQHCSIKYPALHYVYNAKKLPSKNSKIFTKQSTINTICLHKDSLDLNFVQYAHQKGKHIIVYTCNRPSEVLKALQAGVNAIISDKPQWLAQYLKKHETFIR